MANLNRVMLIGNLTRDPELRHLPSNIPVVNIGIAINRQWKNQQGEQQKETTYVDCEAFGKTAEVIGKYFSKGKPIYIEGHLRLDQWESKEGQKRSKMKVIVENFQFIDSKGGGGDGNDSPPRQAAGDVAGFNTPRATQKTAASDTPPINEDDIPF